MSETLSEARSALATVDVMTSQATLESLCAAEHAECLMCGPVNPLGLKLRFRVQPDGSVLAHPLFYVRAELEQDRKLMARATATFLVKGCM
jgi:hypothetical protein